MQEQDTIKEFLGTKYAISELIYRATKDGFTATAFYNKCDKIPNVIVIIKAKSG